MTQSKTKILAEFTQVSRVLLSDHIVEQIADLISRGVLKPGDRIPSEGQLCRQFGVGRSSVGEALRSLSTMGVLESRMGRGTFVREDSERFMERGFQWGLLLNPKIAEDLMEARLMLESQTAYLAAIKSTEEDVEQAQEAICGMEAATSEPQQYGKHDLRFHMIIAAATKNSILLNLLSATQGYLQAGICEALAGSPATVSRKRARLSITEHKAILLALKRRDPEGARSAMAAHILSASEDVKKHLATRQHE
jgi:GntR family transcriptional repressor for pyruvate dehydrogenase complex